MAFASGNGRCYRTGKASSVSVRHQTKYCLSSEHQSCPFLLKQQAKTELGTVASKSDIPLPQQAQKAEQLPTPKPQRIRQPATPKPALQPVPKSVRAPKPPAPKQPVVQAPQKRKRINLSKISLGMYGVLMTVAMVAVLAWGASLAGADLPTVFAARRTPVPTTQPTITETEESYMPAAPKLPTAIVNDLIRTAPAAAATITQTQPQSTRVIPPAT